MWIKEIVLNGKTRIILKGFLYSFFPIILLILSGTLDNLMEYEIKILSKKFMTHTKSIKDILIVDSTDETSEEIQKISLEIIKHRPKSVLLDSINEFKELEWKRKITQTLISEVIDKTRISDINLETTGVGKYSQKLKNNNISLPIITFPKTIYPMDGAGFIKISHNDKIQKHFQLYNLYKNEFMLFSMPLRAFFKREKFQTLSINDSGQLILKRKTSRISIIKTNKQGKIKLNPFYQLDSIKIISKKELLKNTENKEFYPHKTWIIANNKYKNIKISDNKKISTAKFLALIIKNIESNSMLPNIPYALVIFMTFLLTILASLINIFTMRRYRSVMFFSLTFVYLGFFVTLMKVSELYISFIPAIAPALIAYIYGFIFIKRRKPKRIKRKNTLLNEALVVHLSFPNIDNIFIDKQTGKSITDLLSRLDFYINRLTHIKKARIIKRNSRECTLCIDIKDINTKRINRIFKTILFVSTKLNKIIKTSTDVSFTEALKHRFVITKGSIFSNISLPLAFGQSLQKAKNIYQKSSNNILAEKEVIEMSENILHPLNTEEIK